MCYCFSYSVSAIKWPILSTLYYFLLIFVPNLMWLCVCTVNAPPSWPWPFGALPAALGARAASVPLPPETRTDVCSPAWLLKVLCLLATAALSPLRALPAQHSISNVRGTDVHFQNPSIHSFEVGSLRQQARYSRLFCTRNAPPGWSQGAPRPIFPATGSDPVGCTWKTSKGRCPGGILILCFKPPQPSPFYMKGALVWAPPGCPSSWLNLWAWAELP